MGAPQHGVSLACQITDVVDGDTIEVEIVRRLRVRLLDCWAPESRTSNPVEKKAGLAAKEKLQRAAKGKRATLFVPTSGAERVGDVFTFDRVLGHVWVDGEQASLSEQQVSGLLASTHKGGALGS